MQIISKMNGLISVIVPCYNVGPYLNETLESVFNQTYHNWECIIVNDGSPDNTRDVGREWETKDKRFIYLELENGGVERARNRGIERSKGEYILPLDGDDRLSPTFLEKTLQVFREDPQAMLVYTSVELFGDQQGIWQLNDFSLQQLAVGNMIVCTALFRKKEWLRVGGYDEQMKYHWEDWELWINILKDGGKVVKLNEVLFYYRIRSASGLRSQTIEKQTYMKNYMTSKHCAFYQEQLGDVITLYLQLEKSQNEISFYKNLVQQISFRNRLKRLIKNPLRAIYKANQIFLSKAK